MAQRLPSSRRVLWVRLDDLFIFDDGSVQLPLPDTLLRRTGDLVSRECKPECHNKSLKKSTFQAGGDHECAPLAVKVPQRNHETQPSARSHGACQFFTLKVLAKHVMVTKPTLGGVKSSGSGRDSGTP